MADTERSAGALAFHSTTFDLVEHLNGDTWLRGSQIASALEYSNERRGIAELYDRNAAEFTDSMTALVKLPTAGGEQEVRIFSLRGAHLLGMFARTARAAEFRRWVLDVLEHSAVTSRPAAPQATVPAMVGQTFERVVAERDALRTMLAERVLKEEPALRKVIYYYGVAGLSHTERAKLMGWRSPQTYLDALKRCAALGLVDYQPDERRAALGRANNAKMRAKLGLPLKREPKPPTPPGRMRPKAGHDAATMDRIRHHKTAAAPQGDRDE